MQWHQWRILKPGTVHHFPGHEESTGHNWTHTGLTSKTRGKAPHNCQSVANSPLLTKKLRNLKWLYIPRSHMPWFGITNTFSMCWLQVLVTEVVSAISVRIAQTLNHLNCYSVPRDTNKVSKQAQIFRTSEFLTLSAPTARATVLPRHPDNVLLYRHSSLSWRKQKGKGFVGAIWVNFLLISFTSHPDLQVSPVTARGAFWHIFFHSWVEGTKS